jgi:hypothetical protein
LVKNCFEINPPITAPKRNTKFHFCYFQLKSKKLAFLPRPTAAQIVVKFDENPNDFPKKSKVNIMLTITIPENHHDHGCVINSIINKLLSLNETK